MGGEWTRKEQFCQEDSRGGGRKKFQAGFTSGRERGRENGGGEEKEEEGAIGPFSCVCADGPTDRHAITTFLSGDTAGSSLSSMLNLEKKVLNQLKTYECGATSPIKIRKLQNCSPLPFPPRFHTDQILMEENKSPSLPKPSETISVAPKPKHHPA